MTERDSLVQAWDTGAVKSPYVSKGLLAREMPKSAGLWVPWAGTSPTWETTEHRKEAQEVFVE